MINFNLADIQRLIPQAMVSPPTGDAFIDARFDAHAAEFRRPRHYYRLFYRLAQWLQPALSVELGGWQGTGAAHLAAGWSPGVVVSIDHHSDPGDDVHQQAMLAAERQYDNLVYIRGWTWEADVIDRVVAWGKIDLLFIDGWHDYDHAMLDWQSYEPLLSDTALIICDDLMPDCEPTIVGMLRFWDEMPGAKFLDDTMWPNIPMGFIKYVRQD